METITIFKGSYREEYLFLDDDISLEDVNKLYFAVKENFKDDFYVLGVYDSDDDLGPEIEDETSKKIKIKFSSTDTDQLINFDDPEEIWQGTGSIKISYDDETIITAKVFNLVVKPSIF